MRCIDVFNHYLPPKFYEKVVSLGGSAHMLTRASKMRAMTDLDYRLMLMDSIDGYQQIPSIVSPNVELLVPPEKTMDLAKFANDEFRRLCDAYPDKFPSFVGVVPLDDMEKAAEVARYAVKDLNAAGVQVFTNNKGISIDNERYYAFYEALDNLDTTLWIHPNRTFRQPYYKDEEYEKYELWWTMMWPIETTMAASRLVYSGLFQKCRRLRVVLHHAGGMLPMEAGRIDNGLKLYSTRTAPDYQYLTDTPIKHMDQGKEFRKFHADTATFGSKDAIACAISFFGLDNMVFASDMPFDPEDGFGYVRRGLANIVSLDLSETDKEKILSKNALRMIKTIK